MRASDSSLGNTWAVRASSYMPFIFNIPLCVDCIVLPSGMIPTLHFCIGTMFVAWTLVVMRWLPALVSAMPLLCRCCAGEEGYPVVYTLSNCFGRI